MKKSTKPYFWIPSLYFVQGLPFAIINLVAEIYYKDIQIPNYAITFFISLLGLPWVIKPLWSPLTEALATKRKWILSTQIIATILLSLLAVTASTKCSYLASLFLFLMLAFCSATYDIVSDGYYLLTLDAKTQATYVGVRTVFYQLAKLFCSGGVVVWVGYAQKFYSINLSWTLGFSLLFAVSLLATIYHFKILPNKELSQNFASIKGAAFAVATKFIKLPNFVHLVLFLVLYNAAATQLFRIVPLYLMDTHIHGGLNLSVSQVGIVFGLCGTVALMLGVLIVGWLMRFFSCTKILLPMSCLAGLTFFGYVILEWLHPVSIWIITSIIITAQIGFGLANGAYMAFLMNSFSKEKYCTSLYAIGTGIMALSAVFFGMISGYVQTWLGYHGFFWWIEILSIIICIYTNYVLKNTYAAKTI